MQQRVPKWVWMVFVGAHALAIAWALYKKHWDFPDSGRYLQAAENLRRHAQLYAQVWPNTIPQGKEVQEFTIRPPGYPLVLLSVLQQPMLLLLFQNVLSLLNIGVVLRWWGRLAQPTVLLWGSAIACVLTFPAQFIYANAVMSEVCLQSVVLVMAAATINLLATWKKNYFVALAVTTVAALLLKPVFYPLALPVAGFGLWLAWWRRQPAFAAIGVIPLVAVGLYMGWNWQRTGYFHFSSITEINLLHYNAAGVVRQLDGPVAEEEWVAHVLQAAAAQPDFAARQQLIQARAVAVVKAHPVLYARQHLQGMVAFCLDPGRFDISHFSGLAEPAGGGLLTQLRAGNLLKAVRELPIVLLSIMGIVLVANVLRLLLAVRGVWRLRHEKRTLRLGRWVAAGLLLYVAGLTGPLGAARFLVPVWPLLLGLALVGLKGREATKQAEATGANA